MQNEMQRDLGLGTKGLAILKIIKFWPILILTMFSCVSDKDDSDPQNEPVSSSSADIAGISSSSAQHVYFAYCVFFEQGLCLGGPFNECAEGGLLSNHCPDFLPLSSSSAQTSEFSCLFSFDPNEEAEHYGKIKKLLCDERDNKRYAYVTMGTQTWMAENLNYKNSVTTPSDSVGACYNNNLANCNIYGRLYDYATAIERPERPLCPKGWHLPSNEEWEILVNYVSSNGGGAKLRAIDSWGSGNATDEFGFSALPSGYGNPNAASQGLFSNMGSNSYWWSASEYNSNKAYYYGMYHRNENLFGSNDEKTYLFSVRCVKDLLGGG